MAKERISLTKEGLSNLHVAAGLSKEKPLEFLERLIKEEKERLLKLAK